MSRTNSEATQQNNKTSSKKLKILMSPLNLFFSARGTPVSVLHCIPAKLNKDLYRDD